MSKTNLQVEVSEEQLQPFYNKVYFQADAITRYFILVFFGIGILLTFFHDTYLLAIVMGGFSLVVYFIFRVFTPQSQVLRYVTSFLFWNFGLQYLFQMQGLYEMHFFFFISLTILLFYEDWKILLPATLYAWLTVIILYFFQDEPFFKAHLPLNQDTTFVSFFIHFSLVTFYAALCLRWSVMQRSQTRESGVQAIMMEKQIELMDANITFADSISQGNLQVEYKTSGTDRLGQSLLNMRDSLMESVKREERDKFVTTGLANVGEILRQQAENLEVLCDRVIAEIVRYMKANQGEIFMMESDDANKKHLRLMACRAWNRKKYLQKTILLGEGLVGQAALERRSIYMTKVPTNYIVLSSGLGEANPGCILIVPLQSEGEVVGIIELAAFKPFKDFEIAFLEKVGESIASTMITTQNNQRNTELLEKSRIQAEQMLSQDEAIRQNLEEMQATQEEMGRKEKEINRLLEDSLRNEQLLKEKIEEVARIEENNKRATEKVMKELEQNSALMSQVIEELPEKIFLKNQDGKLLMLNSAIAEGYNKPISELIGKSDYDLFPEEMASTYRKIEDEIVSSGEPLTMTEEFPNASGEVRYLYTVKMPFKFPGTNNVGILGYQVDITDIKRMENKVKQAEDAAIELKNLREEVERLRAK